MEQGGLEKYRYRFNPVNGYWFTSFLLRELRAKGGNGGGCFESTLDIGLSKGTVCLEGNYVKLGELVLDLDAITPSEVDRVVVYDAPQKSAYEVLKHVPDGFYKLKAIAIDKAPTLEVNGIHMHRITGIDPWSDAVSKVWAAVVKRGNTVLDTCMGLGYTAIASTRRGAREVYTFEVDSNVVWVAERNPWSRGLSSPSVRVYFGDVTKLIYSLPDAFFHRVIHDPPRFTKSTGDLYSLEFYRQLNRVLKRGGVLFHYVGEPRKHGAPSILKGVKNRLENAGFKVLRFDREAQGYVAIKVA